MIGKNKVKQAIAGAILQLSSMSSVSLANDNVTDVVKTNEIPERVSNLWENAAGICASFDGKLGNPDARNKITNIFNILQKSDNGKFISDFALTATLNGNEKDIGNGNEKDTGHLWVCFADDLDGSYAEYYTGKAVLVIDNNRAPEQTVMTASHEIKHFWHEVKGFDAKHFAAMPLSLAVGFSHLAETDAETFAVSVGWELNQVGITEPWNSYKDKAQCEEGVTCYAEFAEIFDNAAKGSKTPVLEGSAAMFKKHMGDQDMQIVSYLGLVYNRSMLSEKTQEIIAKKDKAEDGNKNIEAFKEYLRSGERDNMGEMSHGRNYLKSGNVFNVLYPANKPK